MDDKEVANFLQRIVYMLTHKIEFMRMCKFWRSGWLTERFKDFKKEKFFIFKMRQG